MLPHRAATGRYRDRRKAMSNSDGIDRVRVRGCLLGEAVGDALGAPVEFMSVAEIRSQFGPGGVVDMVAGTWPPGSTTDDTQMTLFTAWTG